MAQIKKQDKLNVRSETYDQIKFLSRNTGLTMTQLVAEIFEAIFQIGCTYKTLNLNYDFCITESKVTISVDGKSNLICGEQKMPKEILDVENSVSPITVVVKPKEQKVNN